MLDLTNHRQFKLVKSVIYNFGLSSVLAFVFQYSALPITSLQN